MAHRNSIKVLLLLNIHWLMATLFLPLMCHFYQRKESRILGFKQKSGQFVGYPLVQKMEEVICTLKQGPGKTSRDALFPTIPCHFSKWSLHRVCSVFQTCLCERSDWWVQWTWRCPCFNTQRSGFRKSGVQSGICIFFFFLNVSCEPSHEQGVIFTFQIRKLRLREIYLLA